MTVLGWAWPVARQLAQLAVLVFIFGSVLDLGHRRTSRSSSSAA